MANPAETKSTAPAENNVYSVWALPPDDVALRLKKLMQGLRDEFSGPEFEPHITVVGAISLTPEDALNKFKSASRGLKAYDAKVDRVVETSAHCCGHFGFNSSTPYMPHMSILYADLTEEEKKKAQEKAKSLDESIGSLSFLVTRLALYKTDTGDKTLKSWEKIAECTLEAN
ncbi:hypothetical protein ACE6H2_013467 [Prunus campanulata]